MKRILALLFLLPTALRADFPGEVYGGWVEDNGAFMWLQVHNAPTNAAFAWSWGANNTVSNPAVTLNFNTPGFGDDLASNNTARVAYGTAEVNLPYPTHAANYVIADGTNAMLRVALSEKIHAGDWGLSANIVASLYATNAATNSLTITNLSTVPWPRVLAMWTEVPHELLGSNYTLSAYAYHNSAQNFRPVRAVQFIGAFGSSSTQTVLYPSVDWGSGWAVAPSFQYRAVMDGSGFTQGARGSNHFIVYPFYGTRTLSTFDGVNAPENFDYAPLIGWCNKSNLFPRWYANVDRTNGVSTGVATTNQADAISGAAAPFQNLAQAFNAVGASNNLVFGTNGQQNCIIYLTNGQHELFGATVTTRNPHITWVEVTRHPSVSRSDARIFTNNVNQTGQKNMKLRFRDVAFTWTNSVSLVSQGYDALHFDQCEVWTNLTSGGTLFAFNTNVWITRCEFKKLRHGPQISDIANGFVKCWGNTWRGFSDNANSTRFDAALFVGNLILPGTNEQAVLKNDNSTTRPCDPFIWADNRIYRADAASFTINAGIETNINIGGLIGNILIEGTKAGSGIPLDLMQSQKANEKCTNVNIVNVTCVAVYHPPFQLGTNNGVTLSDYQDVNNIFADLEVRYDVLDQNPHNTNRWERLFSVGSSGNIMREIGSGNHNPPSANGTGIFGAAEFNGGFDGLWANYSTNQPNHLPFTLNNSTYSGTTNGAGDYRLVREIMPGNKLRQISRRDVNGYPRGRNSPPGAFAVCDRTRGWL